MSDLRNTLIPAFAAIALIACGDRPDPAAPEFLDASSAMSTATISGSVQTGAGDPLCDAVENSARFIVGIYGEDFHATQEVDCPDDTFTFSGVPAGDYWVAWQRRRLDPGPGERLPQFWTAGPVTVTVDGADILELNGVREVHGHAVFQHEPNPFARLFVFDSEFIFDANIEAGRYVSDVDGNWVDPLYPDAPLLLQKDHSYIAFCDGGLGTRTGIHAFDVPDVRNLSCRSRPSRFVDISHDASRLILSPEPGTLNSDRWDPFFVGFGWGVQFGEIGAPSTSRDANLLFEASLALALDDGVILSGGYTGDCTHCSDFDNTLNLGVLDIGAGRLRTTWTYDDEVSGEGVGIQVRQRSYDGVGGNHVFFHFAFENTSAETLTFNPGMYVDWDIGDFDDNTGGTELGGRLMYATDPDGTFPYVGTMILNREPAGNYFLHSDDDLSTALQADALRGSVRREGISGSDAAYFHSASTMVVGPGRKEGLWMVVLAAESLPELLAAAEDAREEWMGEASLTSAAVYGSNSQGDTGDTWLPIPHRASNRPAWLTTGRRKRPDQPSSRTN